MKQFITLAIGIFAVIVVVAQGIQFEKTVSLQDVLAKAKKENKYIFIDAYASWCAPCKAMDEQVFTQASVGKVINASFVSVKVQMDKTNKDGEFVKSWYAEAGRMAKECNLTAYPTLLFYSPEGKLVHKTVGYKDAEGLMSEAKKALNPSTQYFSLLEQFELGKLDTAAIKALAAQARQMGEKEIASKVAQGYIKQLNEQQTWTKENLIFIGQNLCGSKDSNFNLFLKNPKKVNDIVSKNYAENVVMAIIAREEIEPYEKQPNPDWAAVEKRAVSKYGPLGEERVWGHRMVYHSSMQDWENFGKYYKKYFDRAVPNQRSFLHINNMSWPVFKHVNDNEILATAVKTMKYNIDVFDGNDPAAVDTYANLLYKTGNTKDAIKWEEKAVELSNNGKEFVETLEKMKQGVPTWMTTR